MYRLLKMSEQQKQRKYLTTSCFECTEFWRSFLNYVLSNENFTELNKIDSNLISHKPHKGTTLPQWAIAGEAKQFEHDEMKFVMLEDLFESYYNMDYMLTGKYAIPCCRPGMPISGSLRDLFKLAQCCYKIYMIEKYENWKQSQEQKE